jgi:dTDP-4-dehydrorhamnose 3,5-epimerase
MEIPSDIAQFEQDSPLEIAKSNIINSNINIEGIILERLNPNCDKRGCLIELLTTRDGSQEPVPHIYKVEAEAGSKRGWVYHKWQKDRLVFTEGNFNVYLKDIREGSKTYGNEMILNLGEYNKVRLTIPPYVAHRVDNIGERNSFINIPTNFYDPKNPDKFRYKIKD